MTGQIRALFVTCSNSGVSFWRADSWVKAAFDNKAGHFFSPWYDKSRTEQHPWQVDMVDPRFKTRIFNELNDHVQKADVVVFQMVTTKPAVDLLIAMKQAYPHIPIVTEQDDNILNTADYNPAHESYQPGSYFREVAIEQMRLSDAMIVSTPYLKEVYAEHCPHIYVMPNSLNFKVWDNAKIRKSKDCVRLMWAGGASHDEDLRIIEPVVRKTLEKHPTVRFCLIHGVPAFLKGIDRVEAILQWTRIDRYPQFLASRGADIGLAPLVDNAFNRSKSNLRWLEYAGLKLPTIASNVGHFKETITTAEDGFLCDSEQDWLDAIDFLCHDENARKKIGKNANKKARDLFNIDKNVHVYAKILTEIAERGQVVNPPALDEEPVEATA